MKFYFSGWHATTVEREQQVIDDGYMKNRCFSFAGLVKLRGLPAYQKKLQDVFDVAVKNKIGIMLDSGVVSWRSHRVKWATAGKPMDAVIGEEEFIAAYVKYVKKCKDKVDFYVTIDLERNASAIFKRHFKIEELGIHPVPVFHGDDSVDYIRKYADKGHKLICIASWPSLRSQQAQVRKYLSACFTVAEKCGVGLHGLAFTSPWAITEFPWYSVDSSSWSRAAGFGILMIYDKDKRRMTAFHISERFAKGASQANHVKANVHSMALIKEFVESKGFNYEQLRTDMTVRHIWNVRTMIELINDASSYKITDWKPLV